MSRPKGSRNKTRAVAIEADGTPIPPDVYEAATASSPKDQRRTEQEKRWARLINEDHAEDEPDRLKVPKHIVPDGMEYQWITDKVFGQTFGQRRGTFEMKGWEAVPASRHDGLFTPRGYEGEIEIDGLVLMERPKVLSDRARAATDRRAREVVQTKEMQLKGGNLSGVTLDPQHPNAVGHNRINKSYERIQVPEE